MAWISVDQSLRGHPKLKKLSKTLDVQQSQAAGYVLYLWLWSSLYRRDGCLNGLDNEEIAEAAGYEGEKPDEFVKALTECGWVDRNGKDLVIHDWAEHGLKLLESNRRRQERFREKQRAMQVFSGDSQATSESEPEQKEGKVLPSHDEKAEMTKNSNSMVEQWNAFAETYGLAKVLKLTTMRGRHIQQRLREPEFKFDAVLKEIEHSSFLLGKMKHAGRAWKVDFDFIITSQNNYMKILEGKYRDGAPSTGATGHGAKSGGATTGDNLSRSLSLARGAHRSGQTG